MQFVCYCLSRGTAVGVANVQGEDQKKLDVLANDLFINMLKSSFEVRIYALRTETAQRLKLIKPFPYLPTTLFGTLYVS